MMLFGRKKDKIEIEYDRTSQRPVIRCSICNGEQMAGFKDNQTNQFHEVMLIRTDADLKYFMKKYDLKEEPERMY